SDLPGYRSRWFKLESPLEEFGTARVHQDGAGLGPLEKCIERAPRLAAIRRIHTHDVARLGDQASTHVDRKPSAQLLCEAALSTLEGLEHGQRGVGGPAWRIFDGLEAKDGDDAVRCHVFDQGAAD